MTSKPANGADEDELAWVERVAVCVAGHWGVTLITGRVLGWLMICDPPQQSARQIAGAIGSSRTSLTTSLRFLTAAGLVQREQQPGERVVRYRTDNDAWMTVLRRRLAALVSFRDVAQDGIQLVGPADPRSERMRAARDIFDWLDAVVTDAVHLQPAAGRAAAATDGPLTG